MLQNLLSPLVSHKVSPRAIHRTVLDALGQHRAWRNLNFLLHRTVRPALSKDHVRANVQQIEISP